MKYFLYIVLLLLSKTVLAITQCPDVTPQIHIHLLDEDPVIKSNQSSKELTKDSPNIYSNIHVLGRYNPNIKTRIDASAVYRSHSGQLCAKINRVDLTIYMNPEILLSKEVRTNDCIEKRVINHENIHHGYAKNAIIRASVAGRSYAQKFVEKNYQGYSQDQVDKEIEQNKELLSKEVKDVFLRNYGESNKIIDNDENYKKEAKICPEFERYKFYETMRVTQ